MSDSGPDDVLARLAATIERRKQAEPGASYVASLLAKGEDAVLKKIGEEATETVMAAKDGDKIRLVGEVADLWFHCLVLLARHGLGNHDPAVELAKEIELADLVEIEERRGVANDLAVTHSGRPGAAPRR